MVRPRIIPCLLVHDRGLVKSVQFKDYKYVGDPINAVRIFNEKEVDELIVLDIDASRQNRDPDFQLIKNLANECRMPFAYGGGVKNVDQAKKIINLGAEKIAVSSLALENPSVISKMAIAVGSQSVSVVLDIKKSGLFSKYQLVTHNATIKHGNNITDFCKQMENLGAGEIIINSVDQDGSMKGYDFNLIDLIRQHVSLPITILGGAGSLTDIEKAISRYKILGVAAGSLFVFKGVYKAVLINYPNFEEKIKLYK
jgi:cyclase